MRSARSPLVLLHAIGQQVNSIDADQQISGQVEDLEHWIQNQPEWAQEHLVAWLFASFAFLGLALAATGLYSVVSFSVQQRTNATNKPVELALQMDVATRCDYSSRKQAKRAIGNIIQGF